jgi:hypothetical protein
MMACGAVTWHIQADDQTVEVTSKLAPRDFQWSKAVCLNRVTQHPTIRGTTPCDNTLFLEQN